MTTTTADKTDIEATSTTGPNPWKLEDLMAAVDKSNLTDDFKEALHWMIDSADHHVMFHTNEDGECLNGPVWHLASGVERNREHPDTFGIPSDGEKETVGPGALVKLMFEMTDWDTEYKRLHRGGERMWVLVTAVEPDGTLVGDLDSDPVIIDCIGPGDEIRFTRDHIIAIHDHDAVPMTFVVDDDKAERIRKGTYKETPDDDPTYITRAEMTELSKAADLAEMPIEDYLGKILEEHYAKLA